MIATGVHLVVLEMNYMVWMCDSVCLYCELFTNIYKVHILHLIFLLKFSINLIKSPKSFMLKLYTNLYICM